MLEVRDERNPNKLWGWLDLDIDLKGVNLVIPIKKRIRAVSWDEKRRNKEVILPLGWHYTDKGRTRCLMSTKRRTEILKQHPKFKLNEGKK